MQGELGRIKIQSRCRVESGFWSTLIWLDPDFFRARTGSSSSGFSSFRVRYFIELIDLKKSCIQNKVCGEQNSKIRQTKRYANRQKNRLQGANRDFRGGGLNRGFGQANRALGQAKKCRVGKTTKNFALRTILMMRLAVVKGSKLISYRTRNQIVGLMAFI